jgi:hypothetical protein
MNTQIDILIGKSLDKAVPYTWHHLNRVQIDDTMKEFAELIVRECAELVKSAQLTEDGHTWRSADYVVLEHFGVDNE